MVLRQSEISRSKPTIDKGTISLSPEIETVLRTMFHDNDRIVIEAEFKRGLSGSRVFQVRRETGRKSRRPVVVKVAPVQLIAQERKAYQTWVKGSLASIATLEMTRAAPPGSRWDGLCYSLIGSEFRKVQSLRDYHQMANTEDLCRVIEQRLFQEIGEYWWRDSRLNRAFRMQADYDALLPVNLLIRPVGSWRQRLLRTLARTQPVNLLIKSVAFPLNVAHRLAPDNLPTDGSIAIGDHIHLQEFVITEIEADEQRQQVTLNLPSASKGSPLVSYRLRLENVPEIHHYREGGVIDSLFGEVIATRHDLLTTQACESLKGIADLSPEQLIVFANSTLSSPLSLPNPLQIYPEILQRLRTVKISTIHGDLNMENILVDPDARNINLIDFAAVREGHVLHDLLHLETAIVTKLIPPALIEAQLPAHTILRFYQELHQAITQPGHATTPKPPHLALEKAWAMLVTIRMMARDCLYISKDWTEYYDGLVLYLLGALKFEDLAELPEAPLPKQVAFLGAATITNFLIQPAQVVEGKQPVHKEHGKIGDFLIEPAQSSPLSEIMGSKLARKVFISYKRHAQPDETIAKYLFRFLSDRGQQVFIDQKLKVGLAWLEEIYNQIAQSDFLVVLLSPDSMHSEMVLKEVEFADEQKLQTGRPHILPVRLGYEGQLPYPLHQYLDPLQYVSWTDEANTAEVSWRLLNTITGNEPLGRPSVEMPSGARPAWPTVTKITPDGLRIPKPTPDFDPRPILETPTGSVDPESPFYIERRADSRLKRELCSPGTTTTILAPRQTGKSSLLGGGLAYAHQQGLSEVFFDFQLIDAVHLQSLDDFLRYLALQISLALDIDPEKVETVWRKGDGPKAQLTRFFEDHVLPVAGRRVILALDEADRLFNTPFRQEFFSLIRAWSNRRSRDPLWKNLNVAMVISTQPYLLIDDINQSPFNIGLILKLEDFTLEQVRDLNIRHGAPLNEAELVDMMELLGGHPYLVRQALYTLVDEEVTWAELARKAVQQSSPFSGHLNASLAILHNKPQPIEALKSVLTQQPYPNEMVLIRLSAAGLIRQDQEGRYRFRCQLYEQFFRRSAL